MAVARGLDAATTVSATLWIARSCGHGRDGHRRAGGVHRDAATTFDVSTDLDELARSRRIARRLLGVQVDPRPARHPRRAGDARGRRRRLPDGRPAGVHRGRQRPAPGGPRRVAGGGRGPGRGASLAEAARRHRPGAAGRRVGRGRSRGDAGRPGRRPGRGPCAAGLGEGRDPLLARPHPPDDRRAEPPRQPLARSWPTPGLPARSRRPSRPGRGRERRAGLAPREISGRAPGRACTS